MRNLFYLFALVIWLPAAAQKNVFLTITPKFFGSPLQVGPELTDLSGTKFTLDHFDYYVSGVKVVYDGGQMIELTDQVFLVDPANYTMYLGYLPVNDIEAIHFSVGVPSDLNTSSGSIAQDISTYPSNHPLSFQEPSMYWGWTAGYMHMILGGMADSNNDGIVDNTFELHNLGDGNYRSVQLPVVETETNTDQLDIYVDCNLDQWMKDIPIGTVGILHGTGGFNMEILKNVETEAVFTQNNTAGITEFNQQGIAYVDQSKGPLILHWNNMSDAKRIHVIDMAGKVVFDAHCEENNGNAELPELSNGLYTASFVNASGQLLHNLRFVR
jgi:hypothetical protein